MKTIPTPTRLVLPAKHRASPPPLWLVHAVPNESICVGTANLVLKKVFGLQFSSAKWKSVPALPIRVYTKDVAETKIALGTKYVQELMMWCPCGSELKFTATLEEI